MTNDDFRKYGWLFCLLLLTAALTIVWVTATDKDDKKPETSIPYAQRTVNEDSPLWDCVNMGNRQCGPGCYMEQSDTPEGYEIVRYDTTGPHPAIGFRIPCPGGEG